VQESHLPRATPLQRALGVLDRPCVSFRAGAAYDDAGVKIKPGTTQEVRLELADGTSMRRHPWLGLILWIGLCLGAGALGALVTRPAVEGWYPFLRKPVWTPPSWLFGPVWTVLYFLTGFAAWRVWRRSESVGRSAALTWFAGQLLLNTLWSFLFFGLRAPGWAFEEVVVLWVAITVTTRCFYRLDRLAGWGMTPYLAWVSFASLLNLAIWRLNHS